MAIRDRLKLGIPESDFEKVLEQELLSFTRELAEEINYGPKYNVVSKTSAYTATASDTVILCDASGAAFTVTLPPASGCKGKVYFIKKTDSSGNAATVDGNGSETIEGAATQALSSQFDTIIIISDGSVWHKLGNI